MQYMHYVKGQKYDMNRPNCMTNKCARAIKKVHTRTKGFRLCQRAIQIWHIVVRWKTYRLIDYNIYIISHSKNIAKLLNI